MPKMMARGVALAALLVGSAGLPAAAMADARAGQSSEAKDDNRPDWALLGVACVTLVVGRTVVSRRAKAKPKS